MGIPRRPWIFGVAAAAALLALAPAAFASGPIKQGLKKPTSVKRLKPGVTLSTYKVRVLDFGVMRTVNVRKVAWQIGNPHVQLNAAALGSVNQNDGSIRLNRISSWASGAGLGSSLTAAINGDFFADAGWNAGVPSGMLVHARSVDAFGWGGPAVGYMPDGDMVMGTPRLRPTVITLPGGKTANVGAINALSSRGVEIHGDQVAAYVTANASVAVKTGYVGYVVPSTLLRDTLHGSKGGYRQARTGTGARETVASFRFSGGDPKATASMPTSQPAACPTGTCAEGVVMTVPAGGVVLMAKSGSLAATGLSARAAAGAPVSVSVDDPRWARVTDVMSGKPQLVNGGHAIAQRPGYVDPWQWDNAHWRPSVVKARNGQGWMVVEGGKHGVGVKAITWARMLVQMGASDAMGFDNNSSTELFRPGTGPLTAFGYERSIPSATYLSFR